MILFVDACVRSHSRTRRLAGALLKELGEDIRTVRLYETLPPAPTEELLRLRAEGDFSDPYFDEARGLLDAETLVIAAPYWDLSFPSHLKRWIEAVSVVGLTFRYDENDRPVPLTRLCRMFYVTTAGGPILSHEYGYGYVRAVCENFFGAAECRNLYTEGLDIAGADPEAILRRAEEEIRREFGLR